MHQHSDYHWMEYAARSNLHLPPLKLLEDIRHDPFLVFWAPNLLLLVAFFELQVLGHMSELQDVLAE